MNLAPHSFSQMKRGKERKREWNERKTFLDSIIKFNKTNLFIMDHGNLVI